MELDLYLLMDDDEEMDVYGEDDGKDDDGEVR